jgi:hypothetical protein
MVSQVQLLPWCLPTNIFYVLPVSSIILHIIILTLIYQLNPKYWATVKLTKCQPILHHYGLRWRKRNISCNLWPLCFLGMSSHKHQVPVHIIISFPCHFDNQILSPPLPSLHSQLSYTLGLLCLQWHNVNSSHITSIHPVNLLFLSCSWLYNLLKNVL